MNNEKRKRSITSVKIPDILYEDFKIMAVRTKMGLQDIVEKSLYLYLTDSEYRMRMHTTTTDDYEGSKLLK